MSYVILTSTDEETIFAIGPFPTREAAQQHAILLDRHVLSLCIVLALEPPDQELVEEIKEDAKIPVEPWRPERPDC